MHKRAQEKAKGMDLALIKLHSNGQIQKINKTKVETHGK